MSLFDQEELNYLEENNSPLDDFLGLTPVEMHYLLYDTFGQESPVQFLDHITDETLDQIPIFRIAEEYLKIIQRDKQIKLTPLGALPKKVVVEVYNKKIFPEEIIEIGIKKLWKEEDSNIIQNARLTAEIAGLVKKTHGKLALTKMALKLLETSNRQQVFKKFFQAFTDKFLWSFNDFYPEHPIGQTGWAFSLILLDKFGDQARTVGFYSEKYLRAFPSFLMYFQPEYGTPERQFSRCYGIRSFNRFFLWFGFVTIKTQEKFIDYELDEFERTDLAKSIFNITKPS